MSNQTPLVASVVPDVSGIDKIFDYVVPEILVANVSIGCKVRVVLHGRRVSAWVVALQHASERDQNSLSVDKLSFLISVSGMGVESHLVALTQWMAERWWGSWRATLKSASAPHVREKIVHPRHGKMTQTANDEVAQATRELSRQGSGLLIVPPGASALSAVVALAENGPVLTVCPTQRMAIMGAAALRRRGLTVALAPDDWELARSGVDVVIGARSSVLAPCAQLSAIVVIDEHDELLHEERAPTWDASSVALERAQRAQVPCVLTSPVPSLRAMKECSSNTIHVDAAHSWPTVKILDLNDVPVSNSLLTSELLQAVQEQGRTTVCVLNTKGKARIVMCKACKALQKCRTCDSLLEQIDDGIFFCRKCAHEHGSVCVSCGRSSFTTPRGGVSQLKTHIEASSKNPVVEVTAESSEEWTKGSVFIGTEAVLYRMNSADTVVFADIDRDLGAPRMSSAFEVLALIAKAARMVAPYGELILQTRNTQHPLLRALTAENVAHAVNSWQEEQRTLFHSLKLPPYSTVARILLSAGRSVDELPPLEGIAMVKEDAGAILRASTHEEMTRALTVVRTTFGTDVRVHGEPRRF